MYFNQDNNINTNLDNQFNQNKEKSKLPLVIIGIILILTIFIIIFIFYSNKKNNYTITLIGEESITIYKGNDYIEQGYKAYDKKKNDVTDQVEFKSTVDTSTIGEYQVVYSIKDKSVTRYVTVIEKPVGATYIYLLGDLTIYLDKGEKYTEPGYLVVDTVDSNLTDKVKITNNVDTSKTGTYNIVYTVINSSGITSSATRTVIVLGSEISLSLNTKNYTNSSVTINVYVSDNYFNYLVLPNGEKITKSSYSYKVEENGTYKFTTYNKKGTKKEVSITVSNIDKTAPTGSCSGTYKDGKSTITIKTSDNIGINKYVINGKTYTSNSITINKELKSVTITIYDKAGNSKSISCNLENKNTTNNNNSNNTPSSNTQTTNKPITPTGNEKIIYQASSNTINVWVEEKNFYYVSHIWVKDAYNQFKSAVPPNFGKETMIAGNILKNVISSHNYQSKIIIGANGGSFVLNGSYNQGLYNANQDWNMTSVSPIVIVEGKVLRDFSTKKIPSSSHITYGLKKDGTLTYYTYTGGTNLQSNINISQKIINDGVKNTFSFRPVLVLNGKAVSSDTSPNLRQGLCQIDKNNFVLITNVNDTNNRGSGFSYKSLGDYMVSLGCKTGFNLDGGGSTTLMFKNKNEDTKIITGNLRRIADIIYFHE